MFATQQITQLIDLQDARVKSLHFHQNSFKRKECHSPSSSRVRCHALEIFHCESCVCVCVGINDIIFEKNAIISKLFIQIFVEEIDVSEANVIPVTFRKTPTDFSNKLIGIAIEGMIRKVDERRLFSGLVCRPTIAANKHIFVINFCGRISKWNQTRSEERDER